MDILKQIILVLPILFGTIAGAVFAAKKRKGVHEHSFAKVTPIALMAVQFVLCAISALFGAEELTLFSFNSQIAFKFDRDVISLGFVWLVSLMFLLTGIYGAFYIRHDDNKNEEEQEVHTLKGITFFGFYMIVWAVLIGLGYAGNLLTFYLFYELMSVSSMVLVVHEMTKEAIYASKKYLYYSIAGASMALFGFVVFFVQTGGNLGFKEGGVITNVNTLTLVATLLVILGFGAKAGMFPMHGWLPSAHPVAPAPASAVLSGVITKAGVLGIFRVIFQIVGASNVKGTWVQYVFIILTLVTVFMGSMLAYMEKVFKKRLAYSTVSQVSYVLFGIACLNPLALMGALLHVIFHSILKTTLFLNAGTVIYSTEKHEVEDLRGIGRALPITMITFSVAALGLVGIPPVCGFVSKWYLCLGALGLSNPGSTGTSVFGYVGVAVLLVSALLTAGYLLSITIAAFYPGEEFEGYNELLEGGKVKKTMLAVMIVLAALACLTGIFAQPIYDAMFEFVYSLF